MLKGILEACRRLSVQSDADRSQVQAEGLSRTVLARIFPTASETSPMLRSIQLFV